MSIHKYLKYLKIPAIFTLIFVLAFSNLVSFLPQSLQNNKLAEILKVQEAWAQVARDVASESHTGTTGSASQASFSWTHTPTGTPRGVLVFVYTISATDTVTSVTYGVSTMTRVTGGAAIDTTTEPGRVDTFFLGAGIPTGAQTVTVNRTNNTIVMYATAQTVTASNNTEVTGIILLQNDQALAEQSVNDGSIGVNSVRYAGAYSGLAAPPTVGANSTLLNNIDLGAFGVSTVTEMTAGQGARLVGFTAASDDVAAVHLAVREILPPTTFISNFVAAEPANSTIAPGASGQVDSFGLRTNTGTDPVTGATVTLAAGTGARVATVAIVNDGDTVTYCSAAPVGDAATLTTCGITVTTTDTQFKVKITAISHASMPVPPGAEYAVTGTVTAFTSTNVKSGTDSGSATVTIDNLSPAGATLVSGTAGDTANTINWTTSSSTDFNTASGSVIYRWTGASAGSEFPAEDSLATIGGVNGTATAACVVSSAASTALSRIDGTGGSADCTAVALTNGQAYTYKAFQRDTRGNYDVGVLIGTFTPAVSGPNATDYTNGAEAGLNFSACATTGCGGRSGQSITVTGSAFGTACLSPGTVVKIGTVEIPCADVSTWTATSITFTVTTSTAAFGGTGTSGLIVRSAAVDDPSPLEFFVFPRITSISPSGAGEGLEGASVTITGNRFNAGTATGTVAFANCFTSNVAATLTSWADTSIVLTVPLGISDTDDSCDVNVVRAAGTGSKSATSTAFNVLPDLSSFTSLTAAGSREYVAGDTDGLAQLNGKHFGTATGTVAFTGGFGSVSATIHGTAEGACTSAGWWQNAGTNVCVRVPAAISDSVYTGTITLTRSADSKQSVSGTFRVLPRIIANDPTSTTTASIVKISGDHFCQSGTCPVSPNRANSTDNVKFGSTTSTDADFVNTGGAPCSGNAQAWTDAEICVKVPSGASGSSATQVTSNLSYTSNTKAFTMVSTVPADPTGLAQYKQDGITGITAGATTNQNSVKFEADLTATVSITMILQVEATTTSATFNGVTLVESTSCTGTSCPNIQVASATLSDNSYKWRARAKNTTTLETSNWVVFTDPAFTVDTTGPVISSVSSGTPTDLAATITWTTNESADEQIKRGAAAGTCPGNADAATRYGNLTGGVTVPATPAGSGTSHSRTFDTLTAASTYQYMVRSADTAGNISYNPSSGCNNFTTAAGVTRIMKTTEHYICQSTSTSPSWSGETGVACNADGAKKFDIFAAEHSVAKPIDQKSYFIELSGISTASAAFSVGVKVNSEATTTYNIVSPAGNPLPWFILHKPAATSTLDYPADETGSNTISVAITGATATALLTAKAIMTYFYTP